MCQLEAVCPHGQRDRYSRHGSFELVYATLRFLAVHIIELNRPEKQNVEFEEGQDGFAVSVGNG